MDQQSFDELVAAVRAHGEFYLGRDERIFELYADSFSGFPGGGTEIIKTRDGWIDGVLKVDLAAIKEPIERRQIDFHIQPISDDVAIAISFFSMKLPVEDGRFCDMTIRVVAVFRKQADGWKVVHVSASTPDRSVEEGEVLPLRDLARQNRDLEERVAQQTQQLADANRRLATLSNMDDLTGLANRRLFDIALASEWGRAMRFRTPLAVIMLDVDFFKKYNDRHGHNAGDDCLRRIAGVMGSIGRRGGDLAARYGGEEFLLLAPATSTDEAMRIADTLRAAVETLGIPHADSPFRRITVSLGVAVAVPSRANTPALLLQRADRAVQRAKAQGRNRVVLAAKRMRF